MRWDVRVDEMEAVREKKIFLDGVEVTNVRAFDTEAGWVEKLVLNEDGCAQRDPDDWTEVWEETIHGTVTIR